MILSRTRWMHRGLRVLPMLLVLLTLATANVAFAQIDSSAAPLVFKDAAEEQRFHALTSELRCVMCQNQSLADSNALVARDLRREVLDLMRQGKDNAQVKDFLVQRYGEFVLYKPEVERRTWLLWFGPLAILLIAAALLWRVVSRHAALAGKSPSSANPPNDEQEW